MLINTTPSRANSLPQWLEEYAPGKVDERSFECSDAAQFQVSHAAVHGVKRETGTFFSNKSGAAPATVCA
ncbi:hypothetical protein EMIT0P395_10487 [Pseudomonas sp. IT-P395]